MLNLQKVKEDYCIQQIKEAYRRTYSEMEKDLGNIIAWTAHLALENIANSDALYHDMEHTIMVTLAGQAILEGKHLSEGGVTPRAWTHFMIALLCHDIGYVKGICADDNGNLLVGIYYMTESLKDHAKVEAESRELAGFIDRKFPKYRLGFDGIRVTAAPENRQELQTAYHTIILFKDLDQKKTVP